MVMGLSCDSYRNPSQQDQLPRDLSERIVEHMCVAGLVIHIYDLLQAEFLHVNHKRVYRLYHDANLCVHLGKKPNR